MSYAVFLVPSSRRRRSRKTFSPGHMYDVGGKAGTEERELHPVTNNQPSSAAIDKEKEAFEESAAIAPSPVPRSAITTEGEWSLHV